MSMNVSARAINKVQRVALPRPQDIDVAASKGPTFLVAPGHAPRRLRVRIPVACVRKVRKGALARQKTPPSPNQEVIRNAVTGRAALGPWAGPFEPLNQGSSPPCEPALPELLFMDPQGSCHFRLDDGGSAPHCAHGSQDGRLQAVADKLAQAGQVPSQSVRVRRAHAAELAAFQGARPMGQARPRASRRGAGAIRAASAAINQPRKHN